MKKAVYDEFVRKVNAIIKVPSTSELVSKTQYNSSKKDLEGMIKDVEKMIPNSSGLAKKTDLN